MHTKRILIVDDSEVQRSFANSILKKRGYETIMACDGNEAWQILQEKDSAPLVLTDWMMPNVDGIELCRLIRTSPFSNQKYIILLTSRNLKENLVEGLEAGADDYIAKPYDEGELCARIKVGERILALQMTLITRLRELQKSLDEIKSLGQSVNKWQRVARVLTTRTQSLSLITNIMAKKYGSLTEAMKKNDVNAVKGFITKGTPCNVRNRCGLTPLHWAALKGYKDVAELLLAKLDHLDPRDCDDLTPLHWAAIEGQKEMVEFLLSRGAEIQSRDKGGLTPFHWAARNGHTHILEYLLSCNYHIYSGDRKGLTPLHWAALNGHAAAVELLLSRTVETEVVDILGCTPLHKACEGGSVEVVRLLLSRKARIDARDDLGRTALHFAAGKGNVDVVKLLMSRSVEINAVNDLKSTPLHCAARGGAKTVMEMLISKGAAINVADIEGMTPLHWAAMCDNIQIAELLVTHGAKPDAVDSSGRTPLEVRAQYSGKRAV
ncbi:MAG: ankyrin repeat domain-containing protein [Candidatus Xenobiia bacterium LiM19]